jgi:hemoglobin
MVMTGLDLLDTLRVDGGSRLSRAPPYQLQRAIGTGSKVHQEERMTNDSTEHLAKTSDASAEPGLTRRVALAGAAGLVGAGIVGVAGADAQTDDATAMAEEPSLYDRLGGIFAIAAVVDRFSDAIITNPKLNLNPALKAWNENEAEVRLPGLKFGRTQWVAALAGGPYEYTGLPLEEAHQDFHLTADEFAEVGAEIVRALDYYKVPEREKQELVAAYMTAMPEVVSSST